MSAIFEIKPDGYYLVMFFLAGRNQDWMALVSRVGDVWKLTTRFRYYKDDQVWDSADKKSVHNFEVSTSEVSEDEMLAKVDTVVKSMVAVGYMAPGERPWRRVIRGNGDKVLAALKTAPFASMKKVELA